MLNIINMTSEDQYNHIMIRIEHYLKKGFGSLTKEEEKELEKLTIQAEAYENIHYPLPHA